MSPVETILLLFGVGLFLLAAELFLPTHGLLGVAGAICVVIAVGKTFIINQWAGVGLLLATTASIPFVWTAAMKIWPKTPLGRKLILPSNELIPEPPSVHLGQTGVAISEMRPMGMCEFAGQKVEATSEIGMIDAGRTVIVTSINNRRPLVKAV
jgi:membrane-bound ClpP family serine protease